MVHAKFALKQGDGHTSSRSLDIALLSSLLIALSFNSRAQSLPSIPVSPTPVVVFEYDANGNPTKSIQAPGVSGFGFATSQGYDSLQRRTKMTDAKSGVTNLRYDGQDKLTQVTDPRALSTTYAPSGLGDVRQLSSPDTGTANVTFDAASNLLTRTDSRGITQTWAYDALNRPTQVVYSQTGMTNEILQWTYDQVGAGFTYGVGRLTTATHPNGSSLYQYDAQGRLKVETQKTNAFTGANAALVTRSVSYGYDTSGNVISITYPSGRRLDLSYTGGQLSAMSLAATASSTTTQGLIAQIKWEPFGAAVRSWQWVLANGAVQEYSRVFDTSGRLVRYPLGSVVRDVTYDAAGRITAYDHYDASSGAAQIGLKQGFGYDELGRLTQITANATAWSFTYDANGNRTGVITNGANRVHGVDVASNRLKTISNPAVTLTPDVMGNTLTDTGKSYTATYNLSGRMSSLLKGVVTTNYNYDSQGRRIRKFSSSGASSTVIFMYDQWGHLLGEYNSSGSTVREYVWLGNIPVAMFTPTSGVTTPSVYYIHADHLNTPRVVVSTSGQLRWRWMAEPFGTTAPETNPAGLGAFTQNLRFPGQYSDSESGLFYNGFRDYDPALGRYTQSDPIGLAGGINTYAYVGGNPISSTDPTGLCPMCLAAVPPLLSAAGISLADLGIGTTLAGGAILLDRMFSNSNRPPPGSVPISGSPWSGDHGGIKGALGLGGRDSVFIDPEGSVWVQKPDGSWSNEGPASDYTGSGKASGRRGKDRNKKNCP